MNQGGLKKNLNHHRDTDPNVNNNSHSFDLQTNKQIFTTSNKQSNHINNNNDFSIELKCEVEEQDCGSLHLDSEIEINSNVKDESKGQLKSKSQLNKLEEQLKFNGQLRLEEQLKLKCQNSSKEGKINDIDTQGDLSNCLNGKDSFENACNHSPTRDTRENISVDLITVPHDKTILNSFERKLKSLNVPITIENEHTNTSNIHNVNNTSSIQNVNNTNSIHNVNNTNSIHNVNHDVDGENVEIKPRKRGRKPKLRKNMSKYKLNDKVKKIVSDINGTKLYEDEQFEENASNPNESIENKSEKEKNDIMDESHRKKRTYKKRPKLGDAINLFNKVTRRSESIYEMQLRMAIEMSMKDCKSYEFQEDYKTLDTDKLEDTEGNDDKDSEYEESKPKKKKMVKKVKSGSLNKLSKKRSKKSESSEVSTPKSENNITSVPSSIEYLNGDCPDSRFENHDSNCLNDSQDEKDIDKTVVPSESVQLKEPDETVSQAKMIAFEEYLSMCERFYCGKSLDDDIAQVVYETDIKNTVKSEIKKNSHSQTKKYKDSDSSSSCSTNGYNSEEHLNDSKGWKEKPQDDRILRFNCSRLDLIYRVSFNILKSSLRQPEVIDLWGPKEVVLFELGLFKYGKEFHEIQKDIPSKSVKEIVDMYYLWKKSNRYKLWKANRYY